MLPQAYPKAAHMEQATDASLNGERFWKGKMHTRPPRCRFSEPSIAGRLYQPRASGAARDGWRPGTSGCRFLVSSELADFKTFSGLTGFSSGIYPYGRHGAL